MVKYKSGYRMCFNSLNNFKLCDFPWLLPIAFLSLVLRMCWIYKVGRSKDWLLILIRILIFSLIWIGDDNKWICIMTCIVPISIDKKMLRVLIDWIRYILNR